MTGLEILSQRYASDIGKVSCRGATYHHYPIGLLILIPIGRQTQMINLSIFVPIPSIGIGAHVEIPGIVIILKLPSKLIKSERPSGVFDIVFSPFLA